MPHRRTTATLAALVLAGGTLGAYVPSRALPPLTWSAAAPGRVVEHGAADAVRLASSAFGTSGKLRAVVTDPNRPLELPLEWVDVNPNPLDVAYRWEPVAGTPLRSLLGEGQLMHGLRAPSQAGIWQLRLRAPGWTEEVRDLAVITRVPFSEKRNGFLNGYRIGTYSTETSGRFDRYAPPAGFIEVTPENQDLAVSEHFRLRNFLTKDQFSVWPKYLALDLRLIDKLELVIQELERAGKPVEHVSVMSGFRTPQYNDQGVGAGGRAQNSRHQYGDAADVFVDNDRNGRLDDLNDDGRVDTGDVRVMVAAVERVERRYPDLVGGAGVYRANSAHGPFVHVDVRGARARW